MSVRVVDLRSEPFDHSALGMAVRHLSAGGLVAMPTETVYGFGCVLEDEPLRQIHRLKGRDPDKPFLLLISGVEAAPELKWSTEALELAKVFWPGALTLVLQDPEERFPQSVRNPLGGVAVRVSPHPLARAVLSALGTPIVSTSANRSGGFPARSAEEAEAAAEALGGEKNLWILDGGLLDPSLPSTIIDLSGSEPMVRRAGAVPINRIRCVLPEINDPNSLRV